MSWNFSGSPNLKQQSCNSLSLKLRILFCLAVLFLFSTACAWLSSGTPKESQVYPPVDPTFRSFYDRLDGTNTLGPAISPPFQGNNLLYQYTVAGLMVHNPKSPAGSDVYLAALGKEMGVAEMPVSQPAQGENRYLSGHVIAPEFTALFDKLGGVTVVGNPLGEARHNDERGRTEQYFENLGFYRLDSDPPGTVHLLAYGAWKCDASCRYSPPLNAAILLPSKKVTPFIETVNRLGAEFTGLALSEPYLAEDGNLEQIYENVVLAANPKHPDQVFLRELPEKLGITPDPPEEPSQDPNMVFFPVDGGKGYEVSKDILSYLNSHGGIDVAGAPITQLTPLEEAGSYRQCFVNLCIDRRAAEVGLAAIRPAELGFTYRELYSLGTVQAPSQDRQVGLTLQLWKSAPMVSSDQGQEIGVWVFAEDRPLPNVKPVLVLTLPDGTHETYAFPPTGEKGDARVKLPPVPAKSGTMIPYQVCIETPKGKQFCVMDSYLIWQAEGVTPAPAQIVEHKVYLPVIYRKVNLFMPLIMRQFESGLSVETQP